MKKWMALVPALALVAAMMVGCGGDEGKDDGDKKKADGGSAPDTTAVSLPAKVCGQCGQEAGDACCESGEKCEKCEFVSGSVLCCTGVEKTEGAFCTSCGQVAATDACCSDEGTECGKCGMHEGSPLCCKVEKPADEKSAD